MTATDQNPHEDTDAPLYPHKPPTECPNCGAPVWVEGLAPGDPQGKHVTYECGDSLTVAMGRIWKQDGSSSFPHGPGCRLLRTRRDQIKQAREAMMAVESYFAGECGKDVALRCVLTFLREVRK